MRGGDTHWGTVSRGRVNAVCGIGFRAAGTALPGKPADPAQVCTGCDAAAAGCVTGKRGYVTEAAAQDALLSIRISAALHADGARREQRCYPCPHCGHWHVTSESGGGTR